jgi:hypothetical protein
VLSASSGARRPRDRSGVARIWLTRLRGFSDACGSWKTICISRRIGASCLARGLGDVLAAEADRAAGGAISRTSVADQCRLAATRLADDPERLALVQREGDVVDRVDVTDGRSTTTPA